MITGTTMSRAGKVGGTGVGISVGGGDDVVVVSGALVEYGGNWAAVAAAGIPGWNNGDGLGGATIGGKR